MRKQDCLEVQRSIYFLSSSLDGCSSILRNRSFVQSLITLGCSIVKSNNYHGLDGDFKVFVSEFIGNLSLQVEMGQRATDKDYIDFQKTISANTKAGPKIRHSVLMRKLLSGYPRFSKCFNSEELEEVGVAQEVKFLGQKVSDQISKVNDMYSSKSGGDLFKPTNKTVRALQSLSRPISGYGSYKNLIEEMYFLFHEGPGSKLDGCVPGSFIDVNKLRTNLQHDVDHGRQGRVKKKMVDLGGSFERYSGYTSPEMIEDGSFVVVQANLLAAVMKDLLGLEEWIKGQDA